MSDQKKAADQLFEIAQALFINENKRFTAALLAPHLKAVANKLRYDLTINQVARVVSEMAQKNPTKEITSKELKQLANTFYTPTTKFASEFADLLDNIDNTSTQAVNPSRIEFQTETKSLDLDGAYSQNTADVYSNETSEWGKLIDPNLAYTNEEASLARSAAMLIDEEFKGTGRVSRVSSVLKHKSADMYLFQTTIKTATQETDVFVPVEIKNEVPLFPQVMSTTEKVYSLDTEGVETLTADLNRVNALRQANKIQNLRTAEDFEIALRNDTMNKFEEEVDEYDLPENKIASIEDQKLIDTLKDAVVKRDSKYTQQAQDQGRNLVAMELKDLGFSNPQVRFAGDCQAGLEYEATINTGSGKFKINIPLEVRGSTILPPHQFKVEDRVHDLNKNNIIQASTASETQADIHPLLISMSYPDLKKQLKAAAHKRQHKLAQEIITLIDNKFGDHYRNSATDDYQTWLEESLTSYASRCGGCDYYATKTTHANDYCNLIKTAAKNVHRDEETEICTRSTYAGESEKVFLDGGSSIKISWED
jgi:hypothetical protein